MCVEVPFFVWYFFAGGFFVLCFGLSGVAIVWAENRGERRRLGNHVPRTRAPPPGSTPPAPRKS